MDINRPDMVKNDKFQLEAYKDLRSELQYEMNLGVIDQQKYYDELERVRDRYLAKNSDEWRRASTEIHKWESEATQRALDAQVAAFEEKRAALEYQHGMELVSHQEYYDELTKLRDSNLTMETEEWRRVGVQLHELKKDLDAADKKQFLDEYTARRADIKFMLDCEVIDQKEYYDQLRKLQTEYLQGYQTEWRRVELELQDWKKEQEQAELERFLAVEAAQKRSNLALIREEELERERIRAREREDIERTREAVVRESKAMLEAERERVRGLIEAIDLEIKKRRELRVDEEETDRIAGAQKKLEAAQAQLAFARDDDTRAEVRKEIYRAEQELSDAYADRADTVFYREMDNAKSKLNEYADRIGEIDEYVSKRMERWNGNETGLRTIQQQAGEMSRAIRAEYSPGISDALSGAYGAGAYIPSTIGYDPLAIDSAAYSAVLGDALRVDAGLGGIYRSASAALPTATGVAGNVYNSRPQLTINTGGSLTTGQVMELFRKLMNQAWG